MFLNVCSAAVCYGSALSRRGLGLSSSRETVCQFPAAPCRGPGASPLLPWAAVALRLHVLRGRLDGPRREEGADNAPGKRDVGRVHLAGLRARRSHPGSLAWQPASWTFSEPRRWAWGVAPSKEGPLEKSRRSRAAFRTRGSVCARVSLRDLRILLRSPLSGRAWRVGRREPSSARVRAERPVRPSAAPAEASRRPARRADRPHFGRAPSSPRPSPSAPVPRKCLRCRGNGSVLAKWGRNSSLAPGLEAEAGPRGPRRWPAGPGQCPGPEASRGSGTGTVSAGPVWVRQTPPLLRDCYCGRSHGAEPVSPPCPRGSRGLGCEAGGGHRENPHLPPPLGFSFATTGWSFKTERI